MSSDTPLNPPDSPPESPVIPEGLATKVGKYLMAALSVLAALSQAGVNFDPETQKAILLVVLVAGALMGGRYFQAAMKYRAGVVNQATVGQLPSSIMSFSTGGNVSPNQSSNFGVPFGSLSSPSGTMAATADHSLYPVSQLGPDDVPDIIPPDEGDGDAGAGVVF